MRMQRILVHSRKDKEFIDQLISIIESHLTNPDMDVDYICTQMGMSRTRLYQKIKNITGNLLVNLSEPFALKKPQINELTRMFPWLK